MIKNGRKLYFLKAHQRPEPGYYMIVPQDSSITFTAPLGAYAFGALSQNMLGVPSIRHNGESDKNAVVKALSRRRPRDNVLSLLNRNAHVTSVVYEEGNRVPASWIVNNNEHRTTFLGEAPLQLKRTRRGVVYDRGRVPKTPQPLTDLVEQRPGDWIVHGCRYLAKSARGRCRQQQEELEGELAREFTYQRKTLRGGVQNRPGNYGNSAPLKRNHRRGSDRIAKISKSKKA